MTTTRWLDRKTNSLNDAIALLIDPVEIDDSTAMLRWDNWAFDKVFQENQCMLLNGRNIQYNMIKCTYDQINKDFQPIEDGTVSKSAFIIVYFNGTSVNYIINQNSNAQKMLRRLLSYTGRNEIEKNTYSFSNDFFVWLISKIYNTNNVIESSNDNLPDIRLESIKGVRGDTEDSQTKITADGESVMNTISTLSFLLESRHLNQIKLDLSYAGHENISLILKKDSISIDFKSYQGVFEQDCNNNVIAKLYLLIYLEILPIIEQEYQSNIDDSMWGKSKYIDFMNVVAQNISENIETKIKYLKNEFCN